MSLEAARAANDLMMMFTVLFEPGTKLEHQLHFVRDREYVRQANDIGAKIPKNFVLPGTTPAPAPTK